MYVRYLIPQSSFALSSSAACGACATIITIARCGASIATASSLGEAWRGLQCLSRKRSGLSPTWPYGRWRETHKEHLRFFDSVSGGAVENQEAVLLFSAFGQSGLLDSNQGVSQGGELLSYMQPSIRYMSLASFRDLIFRRESIVGGDLEVELHLLHLSRVRRPTGANHFWMRSWSFPIRHETSSFKRGIRSFQW